MKTMKNYRLLSLIAIVALAICLSIASASAQSSEASSFPEWVIEIPEGTNISIDDNAGTVTIFDSPSRISEGDTFVVYLQDLPIGYVAKRVAVQDNQTIISVEKADKTIYASLNETGSIELTPDMYEFIPASNVTVSSDTSDRKSSSYNISKALEYSGDSLSVTIEPYDGAKVAVTLSNLSLYHEFSGGDITVILNGGWEISATVSSNEDSFGEVPLGELRVWGVGKIGLSLDVSAGLSVKPSFSGTFSAGFTTSDEGSGHLIKSFTGGTSASEIKGSVNLSLKFTVGIDILVAEADLYAEIGVKTQVSHKSTYHSEAEPPYTVRCDDYKIYLFSNVGAEAQYVTAAGTKKKLASTDLELMGEVESPVILNYHFENGELVGYCTEGMVTQDWHLGGSVSGFGSTLFTDNRSRVLETEVYLPWDMEIDGDYEIANGSLHLDGHTLTVNGDLIHSGGRLCIDNGTLIVYGNYRLQSYSNGAYGDSSGILDIGNMDGFIYLDGDLIIQSNALTQSVWGGTVTVDGNIIQINPSVGTSHFMPDMGCNFILTADHTHTLQFADAHNNGIGWLTMLTDVTSQNSVAIGKLDANGHQFMVNGDLIITGDVLLDGAQLSVDGTLYQHGGTMDISNGVLNITGNYYMVAADSSYLPGRENFRGAFTFLKMTQSQDEVRVGGNFAIASITNYSTSELKNGVMYIAGDFTQVLPANAFGGGFDSAEDHRIVFNGTELQTIQFGDELSGFTNVEFQNPNIELKGNYLRGFILNDDLNLTLSTNKLIMNWQYTMDFNDHSLGGNTIEGDFTFESGNYDFTGMDLIVNGNFTSSAHLNLKGRDLTVNGNMISNGEIDMNGGNITIAGTFYQQDAGLVLNNGKLTVNENYYIAGAGSSFVPGRENYRKTDAYLVMTQEQDEVVIGKDFVVAFSGTSYNTQLTDGVMYIAGHFTHTCPVNGQNFDSCGNHKIVFNGTEKQTIQFGDAGSGFTNVEFQNPNIELKGNYLRGFVLNDDLNLTLSTNKLIMDQNYTMDINGHSLGIDTIDSDLTFESGSIILTGLNLTVNGNLTSSTNLDLNGYDLTVNGDMTTSGRIDLNGGTITVAGTLYHQNEVIELGNGKLYVGENYYIAAAGSTFIPGRENYKLNYADLIMNQSNDEIKVGKDFVCATDDAIIGTVLSDGTMYIGGDFTQIGSFDSTGNHVVIFNGSDTQTIQFSSEYGGFTNVRFNNPKIELKGNYLRGFVLNDNLNLTLSTNKLILSGTMNLNGHSLGFDTINGDFTIESGTINLDGADITVNGNLITSANLMLTGQCLTINGDMFSKGDIDLNGGSITVTGTLYQYNGKMDVDNGQLTIGENYYIAAEDSSFTEDAENYKTNYATLMMTHPRDRVTVAKHFVLASEQASELTDGVMYIGGNFTQTNAFSFMASNNHKVVLNGSSGQTITFADTTNFFHILQLTQAYDAYVFHPVPCWNILLEAVSAFGEPDFILPSSLSEIEESAFEGIGATVVFIPDQCTRIDNYAFAHSAIKQIRIPANCELGYNLFYGCGNVMIFGQGGSPAERYCLENDNCSFVESNIDDSILVSNESR